MNKHPNIGAVLLVLLGAASYGFVSPVVKLAVRDGWDVAGLTFAQVLAGTLMLWAVLLAQGKLRSILRLHARIWIRLSLVGIFGLSLTTIFYNRTLTRMDASLAIVLLFQYAWITILLESVRNRRWPSKNQSAAVVLIFLGTLLAVGLLERDLGNVSAWGILFGLLSAVTYGLFFYLSADLPASLDPLPKSAVMAAASLAFIAMVQGTGNWEGAGSVPLPVWGLLLGAISVILPTICFNTGIPKIGGGLAALLGAMELPVAVLAACALLGEPMTWLQGAGIALILAGIAIAGGSHAGTAETRPGSEETR